MADLTLDPPVAGTGDRPLVLGTLGHTINDAYTAFLPALLPMFHRQLGLDEATLAGLVAAFALSASLPGPLLGRLSDRFGEASVTAASVLFSAVLLSLLAVAPSVQLLFAVVAVAGLGSAAIHPAGSMLVRRGTSRPELAAALFAAGGMLGYAAGPSLLVAARDLAGPALPLILVVPGIVASAAILMLALQGGGRSAPRSEDVGRFDWKPHPRTGRPYHPRRRLCLSSDRGGPERTASVPDGAARLTDTSSAPVLPSATPASSPAPPRAAFLAMEYPEMPDVTLLNIGRPISVRDGETILSAALAEGINYPHGCKSGRCGNCKSRLAEGEVEVLDHSRFALPPEERDSGLILACRAVPKGPVSVAWLEDEGASHPLREMEGQVVGAELLTHDILRLRVRVDGPPLHFAPGQYATLRLPGVPPRDYSMASPPGAQELEFHVRRVPDGRSSTAIHDRLRVGDRVHLTGPRGSAHLRSGHFGPILAVAGGSGLAPILSILEGVVAQGMRQPVRVYVGARDERDLYGLERLAELAGRHGDMTVTPVLSSPSAPTTRRAGFAHAAVRADLTDLDGWKCYTAGPPVMIDAVTEVVVAMGLRQDDLHADVFFTPEITTGTADIAAAG